MMNYQNTHPPADTVNIPAQILRSCLSCFPCLQRHHQVHPTGLDYEGCDYLQFGPERRIRVIHIDPRRSGSVDRWKLVENSNKKSNVFSPPFTAAKTCNNYKEQSSSDSSINEYWFTHWKKPVPGANQFRRWRSCNCSCRSIKKQLWKSQENCIGNTSQGSIQVHSNTRICGDNSVSGRSLSSPATCQEDSNNDEICDTGRSTPVERFVDDLLKSLMSETFETTKQIFVLNRSPSNVDDGIFHEDNFSSVITDSETLVNDHKECDRNDCSYCDTSSSNVDNCQTDIYCYNSRQGYRMKEIFKRSCSENLVQEPKKEKLPMSYTTGCVNLGFIGSLNDPDTYSSQDFEETVGQTFSDLSPMSIFSPLDGSIVFDKEHGSEDVDSGVNSASLESQNALEASSAINTQENHQLKQLKVFHEDNIGASDSHVTQVSSKMFTQRNECTKGLPNNEALQSPNSSTSFYERYSNDEDAFSTTHDGDRSARRQCSHLCHPCTVKPLLFFLHGVGGSADIWSAQLAYFVGAGYEVVAPDMLGHGYSSAPDNQQAYIFQNLLQDVTEIFDRYVRERRKCVVIGHSYGSCFAAALARRRPHHVSQLVLISSGGPTPLAPQEGVFSLPTFMFACIKPFLMCGFRREMFYAPRGKQLKFSQAFDIPPYVLRHVMQGQEWPEGDSAFHRRIQVPTLLVHGMQDPFVTLVEECEMERTIPRSILEVIPTAGHLSMLETPGQISHLIHCFVTWWDE